MASDGKHDNKHPTFGDDVDWRKWTQKAKPKLYAAKSKSSPDLSLWQVLQRPDPRKAGPRKTQELEIVYERRKYAAAATAALIT